MILKVQSTVSESGDELAAITFDAKAYAYTARILADVPFNVAVGAVGVTAGADDFYVNEFSDLLLAVGFNEDISVLLSDAGTVWVSEVKLSGP